MAPARVDDDPVVAEYDVFITPALVERVYVVQYPNRPRNKPYNLKHGSAPVALRVKPDAGYIEADVRLSTHQNFNKYMGLKWGDAMKLSKELHNASGTYGPAAGLTVARPRASVRDQALRDAATRELDLDNELQDFHRAESRKKVLDKQTLGGQVTREGQQGHSRKTAQFVGAFQGDKLHLTKVDSVAQLRPQFHHVDAESERIRLTASRTQQDTEQPAPGLPRNLRQTFTTKAERDTPENRMKKMMANAEHERWINMSYMDELAEGALDAFGKNFFVQDVEAATRLSSPMDSDEYLDAISKPRHNSPMRRRKRPARRKEDETEAEDVEMSGAQASGVAGTRG